MQDGNAPDVKTNLILRHKFNRSYKDINVGNEARVFFKETNTKKIGGYNKRTEVERTKMEINKTKHDLWGKGKLLIKNFTID